MLIYPAGAVILTEDCRNNNIGNRSLGRRNQQTSFRGETNAYLPLIPLVLVINPFTMAILGYIIDGLAAVLGMGLTILYWLILFRVLISWVSPDPFNPIVLFLRRTTDPVLEPLRRLLMPLTMRISIDLSPLIAFFIIVFLQRSIVRSLFYLASLLK